MYIFHRGWDRNGDLRGNGPPKGDLDASRGAFINPAPGQLRSRGVPMINVDWDDTASPASRWNYLIRRTAGVPLEAAGRRTRW